MVIASAVRGARGSRAARVLQTIVPAASVPAQLARLAVQHPSRAVCIVRLPAPRRIAGELSLLNKISISQCYVIHARWGVFKVSEIRRRPSL